MSLSAEGELLKRSADLGAKLAVGMAALIQIRDQSAVDARRAATAAIAIIESDSLPDDWERNFAARFNESGGGDIPF